jgi:hypothetical protein
MIVGTQVIPLFIYSGGLLHCLSELICLGSNMSVFTLRSNGCSSGLVYLWKRVMGN